MTSSVVAWLVEYSAVLLNRRAVSKVGRTHYERLEGMRVVVPGIELVEMSCSRRSLASVVSRPSVGYAKDFFLGPISEC